MSRRKIREWIFVFSIGVLTLMGCSILLFVLGVILYKGLPAINLEFLTQASRNFGSEGGILYQCIGTIWIVVGAAMVGFPIALGATLYQTEYLHKNLKTASSTMLFALNGVPSIVFGLFGYIFFCSYLNLGISWVTGVLILGIMIIPTVTVSIKEAIESIPMSFRESALALGFTRWRLIKKVLIPQSVHGMVTGLLLGLARAAGETAPIMFTATTFLGVTVPHSFKEPITTLPTHILVLAEESLSAVARTNAWGAAMVLITIVFTMSLVALFLRNKTRKG